MSALEHYKQAERILTSGPGPNGLADAQAHATLALAGAVALTAAFNAGNHTAYKALAALAGEAAHDES